MSGTLIIGGGFSGLAAGVFLAEKNKEVTILESLPRLGGKAYSYKYNNTIIDNGQHILMGCYKATFEFLKIIDALDDIDIQKRLEINFINGNRESFSLSTSRKIFYPLNLLIAILNYKALTKKERWKVVSFFMKLFSTNPTKLHNTVINKWFEQYGYNIPTINKALWDVIIESIFNSSPEKVSAEIFATTLKRIFFSGKNGSSIVIPNVDLSNMYANKASEFIMKRKGKINLCEKVQSFSSKGSKITEVITDKKTYKNFENIISAIPFYSYKKVFNRELIDIKYSPIISAHIWLKKNLFPKKFYALINSNIHWVFNHITHLSITISNANRLIKKSNEELSKIFIEELRRYFPFFDEKDVLEIKTIKEKNATFIPSIGTENYRKKILSPYKNLFVAGDWSNTNLPSTIESAVLSGKNIASEILRKN